MGIKTAPEVLITRKNGFDIIANPELKSEISGGKYKGFPVASSKEHEEIISVPTFSTSGFGSAPTEPEIKTKKRTATPKTK